MLINPFSLNQLRLSRGILFYTNQLYKIRKLDLLDNTGIALNITLKHIIMGGRILPDDQSPQKKQKEPQHGDLDSKDMLFLDPTGKMKKACHQKVTRRKGQIYERLHNISMG